MRDLTGQRFSQLTVLRNVEKKSRKDYWLCKCDCGNEKVIQGNALTSGRQKSCGCLNKKNASRLGKLNRIDLTNQKFGKLTAIRVFDVLEHGITRWICVCECGNTKIVATQDLRSGHVKTCGKCKYKDITNKRFGNLVAIKIDHIKKEKGRSKIYWTCRCDCGNITIVDGSALRQGKTKTCGKCHARTIDLTGKRFERLTVLCLDHYDNKPEPYWKCKCDCGNIVVVSGNNLRRGYVKSCGCMHSYNESLIEKELQNKNIPHIHGKRFDSLVSDKQWPLEFDFAIYDQSGKIAFLLEYQGEQHYCDIEFGKQQREQTDKQKKEWCKRHNIQLEEIRYDESTIERLNELLTVYKLIPCQESAKTD